MNRTQGLFAVTFTIAGSLHFIRPRAYEAIMPPYLPRHREAVQISGVAEIAGGLAVIHPATRGLARPWLVALLVAVFPANLHMALHPEQVAKRGVPADRIPRWLLWARLPVQALFIGWAWRATDRRA
jgi:uncharacterized membrane protein